MSESLNPVHRRLREAVLVLAAQSPVQQLTVSEICREASATRDSFYRYADSPVALLASIFDEELDETFSSVAFVNSQGESVVMRCTVPARKWLEHVLRYEQVYRNAAQPRLPTELVESLGRYVYDLLIAYMRDQPDVVPRVFGGPPTDEDYDLFATFIVAGFIALFERELSTFPVIDIERTMDIMRGAATGWMFLG